MGRGREGREGKGREGRDLSLPKVNFLVTSLRGTIVLAYHENILAASPLRLVGVMLTV